MSAIQRSRSVGNCSNTSISKLSQRSSQRSFECHRSWQAKSFVAREDEDGQTSLRGLSVEEIATIEEISFGNTAGSVRIDTLTTVSNAQSDCKIGYVSPFRLRDPVIIIVKTSQMDILHATDRSAILSMKFCDLSKVEKRDESLWIRSHRNAVQVAIHNPVQLTTLFKLMKLRWRSVIPEYQVKTSLQHTGTMSSVVGNVNVELPSAPLPPQRTLPTRTKKQYVESTEVKVALTMEGREQRRALLVNQLKQLRCD